MILDTFYGPNNKIQQDFIFGFQSIEKKKEKGMIKVLYFIYGL